MNSTYNHFDTTTQNHYPTGKVLIYSNLRNSNGGVGFIGKLLEKKV